MKGFTICYTYCCRDHSPVRAARLHLRKVKGENVAAVSVLRSQTQTMPLILIIFTRPATCSLRWKCLFIKQLSRKLAQTAIIFLYYLFRIRVRVIFFLLPCLALFGRRRSTRYVLDKLDYSFLKAESARCAILHSLSIKF